MIAATICAKKTPQPGPVSRGYTIPLVDLAAETGRKVVVDREPGQCLGYPTTMEIRPNDGTVWRVPR